LAHNHLWSNCVYNPNSTYYRHSTTFAGHNLTGCRRGRGCGNGRGRGRGSGGHYSNYNCDPTHNPTPGTATTPQEQRANEGGRNPTNMANENQHFDNANHQGNVNETHPFDMVGMTTSYRGTAVKRINSSNDTHANVGWTLGTNNNCQS